MDSEKKRFGYKLSNALLSPRLLRHRDVTLLAEDVFGDDMVSLTPAERERLTEKTNSCGTMNSSRLFSSPVLDRATSQLSKMVPRKVSLSALMSGVQLEKLRNKQKRQNEEDNATPPNKTEPSYRNQIVSEPVPTIEFHGASSSESVSDGSDSVITESNTSFWFSGSDVDSVEYGSSNNEVIVEVNRVSD